MATIIKKIEKEEREIERRAPIWREAIPMQMHITALKEGELPDEYHQTYREKLYERMTLFNPETREQKDYYVNVDDRHLWNDLVRVSDGFINSQISKGINDFRENFLDTEVPRMESRGYYKAVAAIKKLPWYKRLFNSF